MTQDEEDRGVRAGVGTLEAAPIHRYRIIAQGGEVGQGQGRPSAGTKGEGMVRIG